MTIQTMRQPALGITPIADANVKFPTYGSSEAACFDLWLPTNAKEFATIIAPGQSAVFGLGYSMTIPEGWELKIYSRSGQGFKRGLRLVNCVGIIDADYTGEIKVGLYNDSAVDQVVCAVDAIAQGQLIPLPPRPAFFFATEVRTTERGSGGFGSTDVSAAEFNSSVPVPESVELSAAPAVPVGWKLVPVEPTPEMWKAAKSVPDPNPPYPPHYGLVWDAMLAASPTPPAEQQATKETLGGFHVWRDISTAPKDGSRFVATGQNYGLYSEVRHTCVAQWFQGCWMEASDWNETSELKYLTHWMPLPSPPDDVAAPAEQQAAPKAAPLQQEWRLVLPGGKHTDEWESARVGDYNRGWNDYRKAAIAALNSVIWPARASSNWVAASTWLRNNYQDYPNITSLCDAMLEAAPQPAPAPLSDDVSQKVWALLDELEKLRSVNREEEDWDTLNKRSDELRAVLAA